MIEHEQVRHSRGHVSLAIYLSASTSLRYFYPSAAGPWNTEASLSASSKSDAQRWRKGKEVRDWENGERGETRYVFRGSGGGWEGGLRRAQNLFISIFGIWKCGLGYGPCGIYSTAPQPYFLNPVRVLLKLSSQPNPQSKLVQSLLVCTEKTFLF